MNNMANYLKYLAYFPRRKFSQNIARANFSTTVVLGSFPIPKEVIYDPYFKNTVAGSEPRSKYGGKYFVTLVPGAGIGRELADALSALFYTANIPIQFDRIEISSKSDEEDYKQMLRSIRHCGAAIKGYIEPQVKDDNEPQTSHIRSRNLRLRSTLDLYVEVMHFKSHPALSHLGKVSGFDCYLIRPTIEGEFALLEHEITPKAIESVKVISVKNTTRLANYAFKFAISKGLNNVILLRDPMYRAVTGELFTETVTSVAQGYPEINLEIVTTSVISQRIISKPKRLGVIVAESVCGEFFGSVLTGLAGSRGMVARSCYGKKYAVFDPGSRKIYHIIAGKGIANPTSMIMCGVRLLEFFGLNDYAVWIKQAVFETINEDRIHTPDIGGKHTTCDYITNLLSRMEKNAQPQTIIHRPDRNWKPNIQVPSQPTAPFDPKIHMPQLANVNLFTKKPTLGS